MVQDSKTMREKLIELLCKAHGMATDASLFEYASYAEQLETEADFLIANGVTVPVKAEGYSFKDRDEIEFDYNAEDVCE